VRQKNQYRLFFSDNSAMYCTIRDNKMEGLMTCQLEHDATCLYSGEDSNGRELLLMGSSDGFVYHMDKGQSFDGEEINFYMRLNFHHYGTPGLIKKFRGTLFEIKAPAYTNLGVIPDFRFGAPEYPTSTSHPIDLITGGGYWNVDNWLEFFWSAPYMATGRVRTRGDGENMSLFIFGSSAYVEPHNIHGATVFYSHRRIKR
jgi:hypothetical protein